MVNLFLAAILIPLVSIILLWRRPRRPPGGWLATAFLALGTTAFSFFAAPWGYLGLSLRYSIAGLFLAALIVSLRRPIDPERADDTPTRMLVKILIGFFFGNVAFGVLRAHSVPPGALDLAFPLTRGPYVVVHGGTTPAANTWAGRGAQSYGVDVVKAASGEPVVAPCDGTLIAAKPVRLRCGDVLVELRGVESTAPLNAPLARRTRLGRTTEPQVHVHAERGGKPVPVTFDGEWLVRNDSIAP